MSDLIIECPASGADSNMCPWVYRDGTVRDSPSTQIIECQKCRLVTHASDISEMVNYRNGTMHSWAAGYGNPGSVSDKDINRRAAELLDLSKIRGIKSLLDFGCGGGGMISALSHQFDVIGIEPDLEARESAVLAGLKVFENAEGLINQGMTVDAVTLFHVIEHFYYPTIELQRIHKLLNPGGLLIIETPNSNDALLSTYMSESFQNFTYWSHHPMLHSSGSLDALVRRNDFRIISNKGAQRYDLNNHLYWLAKGLPGGQNAWSGNLSEETLDSYERDLVNNDTCDTLWLIAERVEKY